MRLMRLPISIAKLERFLFLLFFLFFISFTFLSIFFFNIISIVTASKYLLNFFYLFKFYIYFYLIIFIINLFKTTVLEKQAVNTMYLQVKYIYFFLKTFKIASISITIRVVSSALKLCLNVIFKKLLYFVKQLFNKTVTIFIFWKPIFKKTSYFSLFRTSRSRWLQIKNNNIKRFKY